MSVSLEGLMSGMLGEERAIAKVKINHNGQDYDWEIYVPVGADLSSFVNGSEARIKAEIDAKEAIWAASPKTREVADSMAGDTKTVAIDKSEIVRPDVPDYYAKRRAEYPAIGDQMDAMWKGGQDSAGMVAKIQAVKTKYPKPSWI